MKSAYLVPCVIGLAFAPGSLAQRPPQIGYVYPAGGQQGTTFEVVIGGQYFNNVSDVHFTGGGIEGVVLEQAKPPTPKEAAELRERLQELRKKAKDPAVVREMVQIARKLVRFGKQRANPALAESVTVQVTVAADASYGVRELRLGLPTSLSNPLVFQVGELPEFRKPDPVTEDDLAALRQLQVAMSGNVPVSSKTPESPTSITLPATVNGQVLPGAVDRYRFTAQRGQRLVVAVSARELIPYLADAVPGWFQATVALCNTQGKELAYDDDFRFHPDPVLLYTIPYDGEYVLEIKDALYRGREDFVYRIAVGELPFVAGIFPLGTRVGTPASVELSGWNLATEKFSLNPKDMTPGIQMFSVRNRKWTSNRVPFAVDTLPEIAEKESNNSPGNAQRVTLPVIVNGRIDKPGDWDVFRLDGRAGDEIVAEVTARRLDSPLDSVLKLTDSTGKQIAFNDDHEDKGSGLNTHHADSFLTATLPADGAYFVHLGDTQRKGGWAYGYRLRISPPRPGFDLRVVPSSLSVRGGGTVPLTVFALRRDGFTNEIELVLKDAPEGYKLSGAKVPANQDKIQLTLTAPPIATEEPLNLHIEGKATVAGEEILRAAVPADDMMQAFAYRHLVPAQEMQVFVSGRFMPGTNLKILSATPVKIPAGGTALVKVAMPTNTSLGKVEVELDKAPAGIVISTVSPVGESTEIVLQSDAAKVAPGLKGNLIVSAFAARPPRAGGDRPQAIRRRVSLGSLPAIPFEIVSP